MMMRRLLIDRKIRSDETEVVRILCPQFRQARYRTVEVWPCEVRYVEKMTHWQRGQTTPDPLPLPWLPPPLAELNNDSNDCGGFDFISA